MKKSFTVFLLLAFAFVLHAQTKPVMLIIEAKSDVVCSGLYYEGRARLINTSYTHVMYTVSGRPLEIDSTGAGTIKFRVMAGAYDKFGMSRQMKECMATYTVNGVQKTIKAKFEYVVKKPTLIVQTNSELYLYEECGNSVWITCPDLGEEYNPAFTATGGTVIRGEQKGALIIIPQKDALVKLSASSNGNLLSTIIYQSIAPPLPSVQIKLNEQDIKSLESVEVNASTVLRVKIVADSSFAKLYPKDAGYRVTEWTCSVIRDQKIIHTENLSNNPELKPSSMLVPPKKGDILCIQTKTAVRKNYRDQELVVEAPMHTFMFFVK